MLTEEEFARLYPITRTCELAEMMGLSPRAVRKKAQKRGIRKSKAIVSLEHSITHKGKTVSSETRERLSTIRKGTRASNETRAKLSLITRERSAKNRGISIEDWEPIPHREIDGPYYYAWRNAVYERDNYTCQDCGYTGNKHSGAVYAHHILDWANHPDSRYDISNGITLCFECHGKRHGWEIQTKEPIFCACGCGTLLRPTNRWGKKRRYVYGHGIHARWERYRSTQVPKSTEPIPCACGCGIFIPPVDKCGRPRRYHHRHGVRARWNKRNTILDSSVTENKGVSA